MQRDSAAVPRLLAAAAILGGLTWIPIRYAISTIYVGRLLGLTYVEWNRLMVIPLTLMLAAAVGLASLPSLRRAARVGGWMASAGLVGMLAGVIVEFYGAGGLAGDRFWANVGWMMYLLPGLLVHVIGLMVFAVRSRRTDSRVAVLVLLIANLHVLWIPAIVSRELVVADQVLIGVAWMAFGAATWLRASSGAATRLGQ